MKNLADGWNRFWFTPADPTTLGVIRIATGVVLFWVYTSCTPALMEFIGPASWIDPQAIAAMRDPSGGTMWGQSLWFHVQSPAAIWILHFAFLGAIVGFTLGWWTRTMNVIVWLGHLSFVHRAYFAWSGMDTVLAMLTFYLMFAPTGSALSLDRRGQAPSASWTANLVVRLIQVHMCIIYLFAGLGKLQGARWWDGTAVWHTLVLSEFAPFDVTWLGHLGDETCHLISNLGVLVTLAFEISFTFLIWNPRIRPVLLTTALMLHGGIGLFMGLGSFGAAMLTGCLAFIPPETVRFAIQACRRRPETDGILPIETAGARRAA